MPQDRAPLAARQGLPVLEAEATQVSQRPHLLPFPLRQVRLAGVLDDLQVVLARDCVDAVHVAHSADDVNRKDRSRVLGDLALNLPRVDLPGLGVDIRKYREGVVHENGVNGGDKGVWGCDDFLARADPETVDRGDKGVRAVRREETVLGAHQTGDLLHRLGDNVGARPHAAPEHGQDGPLIRVGPNRPAGKGFRPDRGAAQEGRGCGVRSPNERRGLSRGQHRKCRRRG